MLLGKQAVLLKQTAPSKMAFANSPNATVMQALRSIGRKNFGDEVSQSVGHMLDLFDLAATWQLVGQELPLRLSRSSAQ